MKRYRVRRSESAGKFMRVGYIGEADTRDDAREILRQSVEWRGRVDGGKLATPRASHFGLTTIESYSYKRDSVLYGVVDGQLDIVAAKHKPLYTS